LEGVPVVSVAPSQAVLTAAEIAIIGRGSNDDVALAFQMENAGRFLFNYETKQWLEYDGIRWKHRPDEYMLSEMRDFCRSKTGQEYKQPRMTSFWQGCLKALTASKELLVPQSAFDANRYILNTPDGTVDLQTGAMRPHDRRDLLTHCTAVASGRSNGTWERFINDITGGDSDLARYLQQVFGSALSGGIEDEFVPFLSGSGRNGKSKFIEAIAAAMGDYARFIAANVLVEGRNDQHPTGMTDFAGSRLCIANEVREGAFFNTQTLKMLSGDATVTARRMGTDNFTFDRTWRLALIGNDLPQIRETDVAVKSRLRIVPFNQCYAGREDRTLAARLAEDGRGVLQWLLDGHQAWRDGGRCCTPPRAVQTATDGYFASQSTPDLWLVECAERVAPDLRTTAQLPRAGELYRHYSEWKRQRGEQPVSMTKFGNWATGKGFQKELSNSGTHWRGIGLRLPPVEILGLPGIA
jgi:putative DNA primase/helicase